MVMIALFLIEIFVISSLIPSQNQTSATNTISPPIAKLTSSNTTINSILPPPSFTGAIIVGITRPVTILGSAGFAPSNISIKEGDSITWTNSDTTLAVLTFQRGREQNQFFTSPVIAPRQEWKYIFWEEGEYNYWSTTRGVEGKVIVEPCRNRFCPRKE